MPEKMDKGQRDRMAAQLLEGAYRVWWKPNVGSPKEPFYVFCMNFGTAISTLKMLADYDLYLGEDCVTSNAGGMEFFSGETGEWTEWEDDSGRSIMDVMDEGGIW